MTSDDPACRTNHLPQRKAVCPGCRAGVSPQGEAVGPPCRGGLLPQGKARAGCRVVMTNRVAVISGRLMAT